MHKPTRSPKANTAASKLVRRPLTTKTARPENPEWTVADFAGARPGSEVLSPEVLAAFGKPRGRPKSTTTKVPVKLRIDAEVLAAYKAEGKLWQTRMNAALRAGITQDEAKPAKARRA